MLARLHVDKIKITPEAIYIFNPAGFSFWPDVPHKEKKLNDRLGSILGRNLQECNQKG